MCHSIPLNRVVPLHWPIMIGHKWALFLDFHSSCVGSPRLIVFWVLLPLNLQIVVKMKRKKKRKEKKRRRKAAAVQSWNNQSINMHIQVARRSFQQVGKVWVALPPSDTENYTGYKELGEGGGGLNTSFGLFRRVGWRRGFAGEVGLLGDKWEERPALQALDNIHLLLIQVSSHPRSYITSLVHNISS
jgi:hypothetical protein